MNATFFETSKEKINSIELVIKLGNFFLKNKIAIVNTTKLAINSGVDQTPKTKGSISIAPIPKSSIKLKTELFDAIRAGNTTETKLIRTMEIEKRKTIKLT